MRRVRCAIYTRKSSEEGLEQDFNSLHAQREACAAYVLSQASEGWVLNPDEYDDGGISGGTLERPALKRLLADVADGKIDIIVVYKVDRLTRSLLDFSKLVEAFDKAGVSFVSITQSFNTTTSMGRLTLNMLLSFAQFEREVTAERIRDKIAASKARGMWMGGTPPLGYESAGSRLIVDEPNAGIVRGIYQRYLALGSVRRLAEELIGEGIRSPVRRRISGASFGGGWFSRGQLYSVLKNPIYTGRIAHRGKLYAGQHAAVIDSDTWDAVQVSLAGNRQGDTYHRIQRPSLLAGLVEDEDGEPLVCSHASKSAPGGAGSGKVRYRYYVSRSVQNGCNREAAGIRVPARELEDTVVAAIAEALADPLELASRSQIPLDPEALAALTKACPALAGKVAGQDPTIVRELILRVRTGRRGVAVELSAARLAFHLGCEAPAAASLTLIARTRLTRTGRAMRLIQESGRRAGGEPSPSLVRLVLRGRAFWARLSGGGVDVATIAREENLTPSYVTRLTRLAFLSPAVVQAILSGEQPASLHAGKLVAAGFASSWKEQERLFLGTARSGQGA